MTFEEWVDRTFGEDFKMEDSLTYFRMSAAWERAQKEATDTITQLAAERAELAEAIRLTLDENGHLADGDVCTLKRLKDAIAKVSADKGEK